MVGLIYMHLWRQLGIGMVIGSYRWEVSEAMVEVEAEASILTI